MSTFSLIIKKNNCDSLFFQNKLRKFKYKLVNNKRSLIYQEESFLAYQENFNRIKYSDHKDIIYFSQNKETFVLCDSRIDNRNYFIKKYELDNKITDPELIATLYKKIGNSFFSKIEGPFSFLIYDMKRNNIVAARDFFGQRPFYYKENRNYYCFSNSLDCIFSFDTSTELNLNKINQFIFNEYLKDGKTFFKNISKLRGGDYLFTNLDNIDLEPKKFLTAQEIQNSYSNNHNTKEFKKIFQEVIMDMIGRTNNSIGTTLSGGLDSSSIALTLDQNNHSNREIFSYSVTFKDLNEKEFLKSDESEYVKSVLNISNLIHRNISLGYKNNGPIIGIKNNTPNFIEPYGVINGYVHESIYENCESDNVKVLFDGLFGDEVISHGMYRLTELSMKKNFVVLVYEILLLRLRKVVFSIKNQFKVHFILPIINYIKTCGKTSYKDSFKFSKVDLSNIINKDISDSCFIKDYKNTRLTKFISDEDEQKKFLSSGIVEHALEQLYLLSSKKNVECFYPFLDKRIISYCINVPSSEKLKHGITRYYFRESLKELFPKRIYKRYTKSNIGFYAKKQINENYKLCLDNFDKNNSEILRYVNLDELYKMNDDIEHNYAMQLAFFQILSLDHWLKNKFN